MYNSWTAIAISFANLVITLFLVLSNVRSMSSGSDTNNIQFAMGPMKFSGVANEEGDRVTWWGFTSTLDVIYWLSEEEVQKKRDERDSREAPRYFLYHETYISKLTKVTSYKLCFSCPQYTPKPGSPGKVYWLSGPPGAGKSTTCQLMARKKEYVYFEADATMNLINPFTDINVDNPSMASFKGKSLKVTANPT